MNDTAPNQAAGRQFTGWHMLAVMVLFFGVVIGVNVFMAYSAISTWTGLVVENSYVASQAFNAKLKNARAQQAMGWQGGLDYSDGRLVFTLKDGAGVPLEPSEVIIELSRPIGVVGDQTVTLERAPNGDYVTNVALEPGVWNAAILAHFADAEDYEHRARLVAVPAS